MSVVDISKITLENINSFINTGTTKKGIEKDLAIKEYQHQYYLKVTKLKRKAIREAKRLVEKVEE